MVLHCIKQCQCQCCTPVSFHAPFLRSGEEERRQLEDDDHAGVDEDAGEDGQSQQAGGGPARVQLVAGASSAHHDGQPGHETYVQIQELQVAQVRFQLETSGERSRQQRGMRSRTDPGFIYSKGFVLLLFCLIMITEEETKKLGAFSTRTSLQLFYLWL